MVWRALLASLILMEVAAAQGTPQSIHIPLENCFTETPNSEYFTRPAFRVRPHQTTYSIVAQASSPNTLSFFKYFEESWGEVNFGQHTVTPLFSGGYRVDYTEILDGWGLSPWENSFVGIMGFIRDTHLPTSEAFECAIIFWEGDNGIPDSAIQQFIFQVDGGYEYRGPDFRKIGGGGTWVGNGSDNAIHIGNGTDIATDKSVSSEGTTGGCSVQVDHQATGFTHPFIAFMFFIAFAAFALRNSNRQ